MIGIAIRLGKRMHVDLSCMVFVDPLLALLRCPFKCPCPGMSQNINTERGPSREVTQGIVCLDSSPVNKYMNFHRVPKQSRVFRFFSLAFFSGLLNSTNVVRLGGARMKFFSDSHSLLFGLSAPGEVGEKLFCAQGR